VTRILDQCKPFVISLDLYPARIGGGLPVQPLMGSNVVVVNLDALKDRSVILLQSPHHLLPVPVLFHFPSFLTLIVDCFKSGPEQFFSPKFYYSIYSTVIEFKSSLSS